MFIPQLLVIRSLLPVLQDRGHAEEHHLVLRHVPPRRGVHRAVRQQGHVERHPRRHGQRALPALIHEVQGMRDTLRSLMSAICYRSIKRQLSIVNEAQVTSPE